MSPPQAARRRAAVLLAAVLLPVMLAGCPSQQPGSAPAPAPLPTDLPDGQIYSGVSVSGVGRELDSFLATTGQPSVAIYNRFTADHGDFGWILSECRSRGVACMISWAPLVRDRSARGGAHASLAMGDIDAYLVARAADARAFERPVFLRLEYEMNASWVPWASFTTDGVPVAGNSPDDYVRAWRRVRIIFEGGSVKTVNAKLRDAGLPPLTVRVTSLPAAANARFVWAPTSLGPNPGVRADGTALADREWYPGDEFVDWVGLSHYAREAVDMEQAAARPGGLDDFYREFALAHGKPLVLAEWGVWDAESGGTGDDSSWMASIFDWMEAHPRVKAAIYFNYAAADGNHRLEDFPRAASVFREKVAADRFVRQPPA